eukprot:scaffold4170_cov79-Cylindrotheca_fusiformis.AAC.2
MQDDDNEAFQTVFYEFPRISSAKSKSKSANSDDDYNITDLDNIPMKFDEDDLVEKMIVMLERTSSVILDSEPISWSDQVVNTGFCPPQALVRLVRNVINMTLQRNEMLSLYSAPVVQPTW